MSSESIAYRAPMRAQERDASGLHARAAIAKVTRRPELLTLLALTAALNLWDLSRNGWANTYYSAAVRSMASSWHDFLFASLDKSGLMTVDKPPLAFWVQALSARVFGFDSLALLIPQALMGIAAVALVYDLTARRFGRVGGFVAGLVLATTPITVAVARHNNPDELLILCCVAAVWCADRGLRSGHARWLLLSAVAVGLGFETKMGVALMVVPGIAAAWLYMAPRGRRVAVRDLLAFGVVMVVVGCAWPLLVELTPASQRPWISGTSDNRITSLIFGYNGLGRIAGQAGGPQAFGGGGTMFGGRTGPFRLLQNGLGDQAGWLLGFAFVAIVYLLVSSRLRRADPRTGWLIAIGGAFLTTAVVFSFASGIFHPYYVSLLAPFTAALVGAGAAQLIGGGRYTRVFAPLAIAAGVLTELVVLGELGGRLAWAMPLVIAAGVIGALAFALSSGKRARMSVGAVVLAALLAAPATWATETLGHATNGTFPEGGPGDTALGGPRAPRGASAALGRPPGGLAGAFAQAPRGAAVGRGGTPPQAGPALLAPVAGAATGRGARFGAGGPGAGGFGANSASVELAASYARAHGGGTIGVASQSSAATAIISSHANIAGLAGFSGRESDVSVSWLAQEVRSGHLRWIITESGGGPPGDTRAGSRSAFRAVERACHAVTLTGSGSTQTTIYDCLGDSAALLQAANTRES